MHNDISMIFFYASIFGFGFILFLAYSGSIFSRSEKFFVVDGVREENVWCPESNTAKNGFLSHTTQHLFYLSNKIRNTSYYTFIQSKCIDFLAASVSIKIRKIQSLARHQRRDARGCYERWTLCDYDLFPWRTS